MATETTEDWLALYCLSVYWRRQFVILTSTSTQITW